MQNARGYEIAVGGVGLALVAFAIAAAVILGNGHDPTQPFWTIASGLAGALIGILAPSPGETKAGAAGGAAVATHVEAATAAKDSAQAYRAAAAQAQGANDPAGAAAAARNADLAAQSATAHATDAKSVGAARWSVSVGLLLLVFVACEVVVLFTHAPYWAADVGKQLQTLAAAAAGGAIGLLAPSPAKS